LPGYSVFVATFNVPEAKSNLSRLLDRVLEGEQIVITRNGRAVAELVPARRRSLLGSGIGDPDYNAGAGDDWWKPMTDEEAEAFYAPGCR
jgi:prevent-host-death family protein